VGWVKSQNYKAGSSDLVIVLQQHPIFLVTHEAYKPLPLEKAVRQTSAPSVLGLGKQIKR
jgi:hypothetical protein